MVLADTLNIFLIVLGFMLAFPALWLLCRSLWPVLTERTLEDCRKSLWKPFLVGVPVAGAFFFATAAFGNFAGGLGQILAIGTACLGVTYACVGVCGLATLVGQRLPSPADTDRPWNATIRGGIVLELSYLLPFLGWFIILPISIIVGAGATTRALLKRGEAKDKRTSAPADAIDAIDMPISGTAGA